MTFLFFPWLASRDPCFHSRLILSLHGSADFWGVSPGKPVCGSPSRRHHFPVMTYIGWPIEPLPRLCGILRFAEQLLREIATFPFVALHRDFLHQVMTFLVYLGWHCRQEVRTTDQDFWCIATFPFVALHRDSRHFPVMTFLLFPWLASSGRPALPINTYFETLWLRWVPGRPLRDTVAFLFVVPHRDFRGLSFQVMSFLVLPWLALSSSDTHFRLSLCGLPEFTEQLLREIATFLFVALHRDFLHFEWWPFPSLIWLVLSSSDTRFWSILFRDFVASLRLQSSSFGTSGPFHLWFFIKTFVISRFVFWWRRIIAVQHGGLAVV